MYRGFYCVCGLCRIGTMVGWSQVEGQSHLTAHMHVSHLSAFCQHSSWLSSLIVKQVSLIYFVEKVHGDQLPFRSGSRDQDEFWATNIGQRYKCKLTSRDKINIEIKIKVEWYIQPISMKNMFRPGWGPCPLSRQGQGRYDYHCLSLWTVSMQKTGCLSYSWTDSSNENYKRWKALGRWTQPSCLYI